VTNNWQRFYINSQAVAAVTQILGYKQAYNRPLHLGTTNCNTRSQHWTSSNKTVMKHTSEHRLIIENTMPITWSNQWGWSYSYHEKI